MIITIFHLDNPRPHKPLPKIHYPVGNEDCAKALRNRQILSMIDRGLVNAAYATARKKKHGYRLGEKYE
jgi:hypothetical protein